MMLAAMGGLFVGCEPDVDDDEGGTTGKQLSVMTVVQPDEEQMRIDIEWRNNLVNNIDMWWIEENGEQWHMYEISPSYDNDHLVESINLYRYDERQGINLSCYYTAGRLSQIVVPHEGSIILDYGSDGNLSSLSDGDEEVRLMWSNGNITRIEAEESIRFYYDQKKCPLNGILSSLLGGWTASINNPTAIVNEYGESVDIQYSYDGDWPTKCLVSTDDGTAQIYFKYTDGTGLEAPSKKMPYTDVNAEAVRPQAKGIVTQWLQSYMPFPFFKEKK